MVIFIAGVNVMEKKEQESTVRTWPIKTTARFLVEFEKIASKFHWYFFEQKRGRHVFKEIRGVKKGNDLQEYSPLTALVESQTGRFFDMDRFDLAASEIFMTAECAMQIVDASDEWPDKMSGYISKSYEKGLRRELERICIKNS
jgi:hypothetical protein